MINVGVIGSGYWGPNVIRNFYENEETKVLMCADLNKNRLASIASRYPIETTTDYKDITRHKDIDVVAVVTPLHTHYELAKEALLNGKNVWVEKPLASNSRDAQELIELAEKQNKILLVDHTFIYTGAVRKMKAIISSGELGDVYYFDSVRINLGLFQKNFNVVWDLAPHDLSIMDYILGKTPVSIIACGLAHFNKEIENVAYLTLLFQENLIAHFHLNWLAPVKVRQTLVCGKRKMIIYDDTEPSEKVKVYDKGVDVNGSIDSIHDVLISYRTGDMYAPKLDQTEALKVCVSHFVQCIQQNKKPITDGEAGLRVIRVLEAAEKSIKNQGKSEYI